MSEVRIADRSSPPEPPEAVVQRVEDRLRRHLGAAAVAGIRDAVLGGKVVRMDASDDVPGVVAFKRGVLFVAGREYVISDE